MAAFQDAAGREWTVRITVGDLDDLAAAGLDVEAVAANPGRLTELAASPRKLAAVLWALVGEQVTAKGVSPQDFKAALDGSALFAAGGAIEDAILDFSHPPVIARTIQAKRGETEARLLTDLAARVAAVMDTVTLAPDGSTGSAGSSPASPASTPAPSASADSPPPPPAASGPAGN